METGGCTRFSEIYCIISVFNCHYGKQDRGCTGFGGLFNISETKVKHYKNNRMLFSYHQMKHNIYRNGGTDIWQSQN